MRASEEIIIVLGTLQWWLRIIRADSSTVTADTTKVTADNSK